MDCIVRRIEYPDGCGGKKYGGRDIHMWYMLWKYYVNYKRGVGEHPAFVL